MVYESNFCIRQSARKLNAFYIDYRGEYKTADIARLAGVSEQEIKGIYKANNGTFEETMAVWYFESAESAKSAVNAVLQLLKEDWHGRMIMLTEEEVEYIRRALINDNMSGLRGDTRVKDTIFKKLNG